MGAMVAQEGMDRALLLENFERGKVYYKKGGQSSSSFNYDILNEELLFKQSNSEYLKLAEPNTVALVEIGNRTFEHIKDGLLYEKIPAGDDFLFVRWKSRAISEGKTGLYGTKSTTTSSQSISRSNNYGSVYDFTIVDNTKLIADNKYYVKIKNKFKQFNSFNALAKLFDKNKQTIEDYIKTENLNFDKQEDIIKAVKYCFSLK